MANEPTSKVKKDQIQQDRDDAAKTNNDGKTVAPALAGAVGAVVGAGVGVAATLAMNDENTRGKVKAALNEAKDTIMEYAKEAEAHANKNPQLKEAKKALEKTVADGKKALAKKTK